MTKLIRTNSADPDFLELISLLDQELEGLYGDEQRFFAQFNNLNTIPYTVIGYQNNNPVACGAIKPFAENMAEVKRMYVIKSLRGQGIAGEILKELESWARELHFSACILQTGDKQPEAVQLYKKNGYTLISNYSQYENDNSSICMKKDF
jgi:GNAT superfamily N-acetyltransferase